MPRDEEYPIGYKKPPTHTQFKKGQSGNPKGRPKGVLNVATALNKALAEKITVVENGRRKQVTKLHAAIVGMTNRAVKGDAKAMQQMLSLSSLVGEAPAGRVADLSETDAAVMASLMQRLRPAPPKIRKGPKPGKRKE